MEIRSVVEVHNRPARDIEPGEITELIRPIYDRGKRSMNDHVRSYIRSPIAGDEVGARLSEHVGSALSPRIQSRGRHSHRTQESGHALAR